jgi:hypothetical protein
MEENAEKAKYMVMSHVQNAGRNHNRNTGNTSFEREEQIKNLGETLTKQNSIREEIESRLNTGNTWLSFGAASLVFSLLSKYINRTIILPLLLCGCETWSLTLNEEHSVRMFKNRVLREIFEAKRDEVTGEWRRLHNEEFYDLCSSLNTIWLFKLRRMRRAEHVARMGAGEVHSSWWGNLRERDRLEYLGVDWGIILKWILRKWDGEALTGLVWLRIGTGGGLF